MAHTDRENRIEYAKHRAKTHYGWRKSADDKAFEAHTGIGSNGAPDWDPEAPVTGFPMVMRDIRPFDTQDGKHIGGRAQLRAYEREHGIKQLGNDWGHGEKPSFFDEMKDRAKFKAKQRKAG